MLTNENVTEDAALIAVEGEPLVIGVGTEIAAENGRMWVSKVREESIAVEVQSPFQFGDVVIHDGVGFSFEELSSLLKAERLHVTGVRDGNA